MKYFLILVASITLSAQEFTGFVEYQVSGRLNRNYGLSAKKDYVLNEARFQLKYSHSSDLGEVFFKSDFISDQREKKSFIDLREAYIYTTLNDWIDLKIGRQIQTWGLGDLLFINDLFPKDWISFFSGRQDDYLKAPSNALRMMIYPEILGIEIFDLSFTPNFEPDRELQSEKRFASVNPLFNILASNGLKLSHIEKENAQNNFELAIRVKMNSISGINLSLYAYRGFNKSAQSFLLKNNELSAFHSRLNVYGASLRSSFLSGIISAEYGYYHSLDDKNGDLNLVSNSSHRALVLYEKALSSSIDLGLQLYAENIIDYKKISSKKIDPMNLFKNFDAEFGKKETRFLNTVRLTVKTLNETLRFSIFNFWSPSDKDFYFRPRVSYDFSDQIRFYLTGNIFDGYGKRTDKSEKYQGIIPDYHNSMFSQFNRDKNINFTMRYIF